MKFSSFSLRLETVSQTSSKFKCTWSTQTVRPQFRCFSRRPTPPPTICVSCYWLNSTRSRIPLVKPFLRRGACSYPNIHKTDNSKVALRPSVLRRNIESKPGLFLPLPFDFPPDNKTAYTCIWLKTRVERWGLNCSWYLGRKSKWQFARQQIKKNWEIKVKFKPHCLIHKTECLYNWNQYQSVINLQLGIFF